MYDLFQNVSRHGFKIQINSVLLCMLKCVQSLISPSFHLNKFIKEYNSLLRILSSSQVVHILYK